MDPAKEVALVLLPVTIFGSILNWSVFYSFCKLPVFKNAFGILSANQAFADALHSTTFLLYFCPMVLFDQSTMKQYSHHCGFFILFLSEFSILTHFIISINRAFAVWAPYRYETLFSVRNTKILKFIVWIFISFVAILFYEKFCYIYYDSASRFFVFTATEFCGVIAWYGDFLKNAAIVIATVSLDIITVLRVRHITKKISGAMSEEAQNNISARDIRFLKQAVAQATVFLCELTTYFFFPLYFENYWILFFGTSFAWVGIHAADGIIVVVCHPEVRSFLLGKKVSQVHSVSIRTTTAK
ncbi:G-protein coupled receptors family 1 profile domain-containing protein [Caenorhabditis elegans]|uniref:G-protein coupled receptors family 1 profile domain-containing protein n=1 Tax=Caenorhabditis elegans TaxID=6239 RepID=O01457_CAEEL|nr:G-protein coupled receptors family 1 profile domain-containing protein [Caenorhabditis elegans]CCD62690.1 G-protein coupled receptors family 1 profile domain-containing protein [Caenorhabditis elegans]|eukprot:NP_504885.2 Serpentine Receptor, class X [Caenorhabditis elegans]